MTFMHWETCRNIFGRYGLVLMGYSDGTVYRCHVYHKRCGVLRLDADPVITELEEMSEPELDQLARYYSLLTVFS